MAEVGVQFPVGPQKIMKNNFEKKSNNWPPRSKLSRREMIKNTLKGIGIGGSIGITLAILKNIIDNYKTDKNDKNKEKILLALKNNIEKIRKEVENYLEWCDNYHNFLEKKLDRIENDINDTNGERYIQTLKNDLEILNDINKKLDNWTIQFEKTIEEIKKLNINRQDKSEIITIIINMWEKTNKRLKINLKFNAKILSLLKLIRYYKKRNSDYLI